MMMTVQVMTAIRTRSWKRITKKAVRAVGAVERHVCVLVSGLLGKPTPTR
jgi:hypothetical protein